MDGPDFLPFLKGPKISPDPSSFPFPAVIQTKLLPCSVCEVEFDVNSPFPFEWPQLIHNLWGIFGQLGDVITPLVAIIIEYLPSVLSFWVELDKHYILTKSQRSSHFGLSAFKME